MALEIDNPYRQAMVVILQAINQQIPLSQASYWTICYHLETEKAIIKFVEWVQSNLNGERLVATEVEIVRAAVQASRDNR